METMQAHEQHAASAQVQPTPTRLLVALSGGSEDAALVRAAHRLASRDHVHWCAAYVESDREDTQRRLMLERDFAQVQRLGGDVRVVSGQDRARELLALAGELKVATLLVGHGRPSGWRIWRRPLAERLARLGGPFDLVVAAEARQRPRFRPRPRQRLWHWRDTGIAVSATLAALALSAGLKSWLALGNLSLLFLGAVLVSAALAGTRAAMLAAVLGFVSFNFFLTEPRYSLAMVEDDQLVTVVVYLLVAVVAGQLAGNARTRLLALRASREQTYQLLTFSRELAVATDRERVAEVGVSTLMRWLGCPVVMLEATDEKEDLAVLQSAPAGHRLDPDARSAVAWSRLHRRPSGKGTEQPLDSDWQVIPLVEQGRLVALICLALGRREHPPSPDEEGRINAMLRMLALALERTRLVADLEASRLSEENERLRSALLSSVSHDLRTPLASIIGSASTLRELADQLDEADRIELLDGILSESERLDRYIQNLLDMTRLGQGGLKLERDWISLEDLVASALRRLGPVLKGLHIERDWPEDLPLLNVHPALIEQALVNVIENAARFSPPGGVLRLEAGTEADQLWLAVIDRGPGIEPHLRERVFDMFYTGGEGDRGRHGSGLGLAICRGMLGAHTGTIVAEPGRDGIGTRIVMRLPLPDATEEPRHHVE
ncbi:Sensor protein KdpD [Halomonas lysinitropha]|uniref:histidine kinase n=1 Tax=Halomonas lysinitropha TaxID=2607506 RepID=A0A5K1I6Y5_9GAMM|nr:Sensor protein KdpD [Halomonas lysinitropha]